MARNEKIAEKMGWIKYFGDEPVITDSGHKVSFQFIRTPDGDIDFDLKIDVPTAHLLIERMVADGWDVNITHCSTTKKITAWANRETKELIMTDIHVLRNKDGGEISFADFPTAVVELFCRVYGITV